MNYYSIKDLETYSGIKAHTIRMWEKRYNLLYPVRTDTNIRQYDDEQLIKLLNTVTLLESGWKISKVSQLTKPELIKSTEECLTQNGFENYLIPINQLVSAMFDFDEKKFNQILNSCIDNLGVYTTISQIAYPLLKRIAMMWRLDEISPAQEHFASNIIRQKLIHNLDTLSLENERSNSKFALFLPTQEYHELGLLMGSYILRSKHFQTYYLGCNTPLESVQHLALKTSPTHLFTFIITRKTLDEIHLFIQELSDKFSRQEIWIAGHETLLSLIEDIPDNIRLIPNLQVFDEKLSQLD